MNKPKFKNVAALEAATAEMLAAALEEVMQGNQLPHKAAEFLDRRRMLLDQPRKWT